MKHILLILLVFGVLVGCSTSSNKIAYKTADSMIVSVDASMKVWARYVVETRTNLINAGDRDGLAKLFNKEQKVRSIYEDYSKAVKAFVMAGYALSKNSTNSIPPSVESQVIDAAQPVIQLIQQLQTQ